jgi:hypothetical protein
VRHFSMAAMKGLGSALQKAEASMFGEMSILK